MGRITDSIEFWQDSFYFCCLGCSIEHVRSIHHVSVILPVRNEEENLSILIPSILKRYDKNILEILVVDDNSTDGTARTVLMLQKKFPKVKLIQNKKGQNGVGVAIREGIRHVSRKATHILTMDADFLTNVADIANFLHVIPEYDGVVGSRFLKKESLTHYPFVKLIANRSYHMLAKGLLGIVNSDLTNNFKLYNVATMKKISPMLKSTDFSINAELGFYPILLGARIGEVSVKWEERTQHMGVSKFKIFRVGPSYARVFVRLLKIKFGMTTSQSSPQTSPRLP